MMKTENIKLTRGLLTRDDAKKLSPAYVAFIEQRTFDDVVLNPFFWDYEQLDKHGYPTCPLRKGQSMLTFLDGHYVTVKISSVKHPQHDADGPIIRVTNGEYSWRVDGDRYGVKI